METTPAEVRPVRTPARSLVLWAALPKSASVVLFAGALLLGSASVGLASAAAGLGSGAAEVASAAAGRGSVAPGDAAAGPARAVPDAYWVQLPRERVASDAPSTERGLGNHLPYAPAPNRRALERRRRRGDPAAIARLIRGPDPASVSRVAAMVERVRFVSRWLSAVSVEVDAPGLERLRQEFGAQAVRPVARLRWVVPDAMDAAPEAGKRDAGSRANEERTSAGTLDYGPSEQQNAQIQVDALHAEGLSGAGVRVLVLDTGFLTSHPALSHLDVVAEWDFVFGDGVTHDQPQDVPGQQNHGTAVLGTLAGYAPGQLIGPAYGADVLLAKTEDVRSETQLEEDNFVAALEWGEALGADVATASLGYTGFDDGFVYPPEAYDGNTAVTTRAMDDAVALGVVACGAAGNRGPDPSSLMTPGDADSMITVGAVDSVDAIRNFSSRGPTYDGRIKPDVVARGFQTVASAANGTYGLYSGTSLATPLVAGAAALLLELHPEWNPIQLRAALWSTASQSSTPDNDRGFGVVRAHDAGFAVEDPVVPLPFALIDPADGASTSSAVTFRWHRPRDFQTPADLDSWVQFSTNADFADTVGVWSAGEDTTRTIDFLPSGSFHWRVVVIDPQGHTRASGGRSIHTNSTASPEAPSAAWVRVSPPVPNPFNPSVRLRVELRRPAQVQIDVYDAAGRRVRSLGSTHMTAGEQSFLWDGRDQTGADVSSASYLARLRFTDQAGRVEQVVRRLTLLR
jgi:serine protease AprX